MVTIWLRLSRAERQADYVRALAIAARQRIAAKTGRLQHGRAAGESTVRSRVIFVARARGSAVGPNAAGQLTASAAPTPCIPSSAHRISAPGTAPLSV